MNHIKIIGAIVGVIAFVALRGGLFVSMPKLTRPSADVVVAGDPSDDYARYAIGEPRSFSAASLGYDFKSMGGGLISQLGGRGLISYIDPALYRRASETCRRTGQCFGNVLSAHESSIGHLILIPQDKSALDQMRTVRIKNGGRFRLAGRSLALIEARTDGQPMSVQLGATGCFLVESVAAE